MSKLFLSYRRSDRYAAGLLRAEIVRRLGSSRFFMDTSDLRAGDDFPTRTEAAINDSSALLVLIGPGWESELGRLAEPGDWVRRELETAVDGGTRLVPVLLDDAQIPDAQALPESLRGLVDTHAYRVTSAHLDRDIGGLLTSIGERRRRGRAVGAALAIIFAVLVGAFVLRPSEESSALSFLNTMLVFDASSGMKEVIPSEGSGQIAKSDVAADQVRRYIETRDGDKLALRIADSCGAPGDLAVSFQTNASDKILESLANTSFTGDSFPLAAAIIAATADFNDPDTFPADAVSKQIIVFTTTGSRCETDPAALLAERWDELGDIRLRVELIGLGIQEGTEAAAELRRAAASVKGRAFPVTSSEDLDRVLRGLLEVEPVQLAAQEVTNVGNSIARALSDVGRANDACDSAAAETAAGVATSQSDAAEPALEALAGRDDFEAFAAVHESGEAWAESLTRVIPAGEELTSQIEGVEGDDECDEVRRSDEWRAAIAEWNGAVGEADAALSDLDVKDTALREEIQAILDR